MKMNSQPSVDQTKSEDIFLHLFLNLLIFNKFLKFIFLKINHEKSLDYQLLFI